MACLSGYKRSSVSVLTFRSNSPLQFEKCEPAFRILPYKFSASNCLYLLFQYFLVNIIMPLSRDIPSSSKGNRGMSSSYPPTNPRSRETLYRTQGWERNTFGDFPPDPMASIMCLPSTSGYNATRSMRFPDETTMGRQYDNYKEISDTAAAASTQYKRERRELGTHMSKISREGHGQLSARSESIVDHRKE